MKTKDRFKKKLNASGKITWYFHAFRTTRRGFKTKREAQLAYLELRQLNEKKRKIAGSHEQFSSIADMWFYHYKELGEQKESTYDKRKESIKTLSLWIGDKKLNSFDSDFMTDFLFDLKDKGYAKNSLYSFKQTLNMIFKFCVKNKMLSENPLEGVSLPKYQQTVQGLKQSLESLDQKYLTLDELRTLLNYSIVHEDLTLSTLFHVLFYTGCRVSEALALQPEDIDFEKNEVLFYKQTAVKGKQINFKIETTKSVSSARRVVVTPLVIEKLKTLINVLDEMRSNLNFVIEEPYLFVYLDPSKRGVPFRREYVNDHIKNCVKRCGISKPFHTHLTRHTMASLVADHCSWDVLKARLGHADKSTSEIYRHLTADERLKPLNAFSDLES
ncbi:tyrosine-type recombinase/integrase [Enterococcus sp. DIV0756]|uniref:tyrosine-type recombinase/integrase n=1 Tax=Enterococcus sp. DIV0756 TaxID=2774636 RepID=UPI003F248D3E